MQEAEIDSEDKELEEAYKVKQRARTQAKKAYRNYKDSRRRVREIKKERQPYMPVVALNPDAAPADHGQVKPTEGAVTAGMGPSKGPRRWSLVPKAANLHQPEKSTLSC